MQDIGKSIASEVPLRPNLATIRQQVETEEYAAMRATTRRSTSAAAERGGGSRMANNLNRPSDSFYRPRKNGCDAMFTSGAQLEGGARSLRPKEPCTRTCFLALRAASGGGLFPRRAGPRAFFSPPPRAPAAPRARSLGHRSGSSTAQAGQRTADRTSSRPRAPWSSQMSRERRRSGRLGRATRTSGKPPLPPRPRSPPLGSGA